MAEKKEEMLPDSTGRSSTSFAKLILNKVHTLKNASPKIEMPDPKVVNKSSLELQLERSNQAKLDILRRAKENQDHYILVQMEDNERKPWFMYPKYTHQYSEFIMINPEMAQVMIDHLWSKDEGNRNFKPTLFEAYRRDIREDHWVPSDEGIGINLAFEVYNGQHRLRAIVAENKEMPMYVTWNVLEEAKFFVDSGAQRNLSERLKMVIETKLGPHTSGFCKAIMRGTNPRAKFTNSEVALFASKWQDLISWIHDHYPKGRAEVQAVLAKAYLWYGPELIEPFCHRLREIKFGDNDPAKALYVSLQISKKNRTNVALLAYKKTLQAINALVNRRAISKLHERDEDIFQWLPGWELPPKPTKE